MIACLYATIPTIRQPRLASDFMQNKPKHLLEQPDMSYHWGLVGMVSILLMTFTFATNGLNTDVVWFDELTSVGHMGVFNPPYSLTQILDSIADKSSQHMPLFFVLGAGWAQVAGWSQVALRLISAFAGMLLIAWMYRFGADFINRRTGLVASLLLGSSAFTVIYLHEIRMYSLLLMLATMHTWLYWRIAHKRRITRVTWLLFILTTSALFYTHIFSTVLFAGLGIYHLLFVGKSRQWLMVLLGWGMGAVLFLPYVPIVIKGFDLATNKVSTFTTALSTPELIETLAYLLTNGLPAILIPLVGLFLYTLWRTRNRMILRFLFVTVVMLVTLIFINERFGLVPLRRARYLLILWFPFLMLFAYGMTAVPRWVIVTAGLVMMWGVSGWNLYRLPSFADHIGTIDAVNFYPPMQNYIVELEGKTRPHDYVVGFTDANFVNKESKHGKSTADYYMEAQLGVDGTFIPSYFDAEKLEIDIPEKLANHPYLLFTYNPQDKPDNFDIALNIIQQDYIACEIIIDKADLFVQRFVHVSFTCDRKYAPIVYENGITIVDKDVQYNSTENTVQILSGWEVADEHLLYEYNVSIQIVTGDWQNVGQTDRHLHDDLLKWYTAELPTENLEAGEYRVMIIIYHQENGEKVIGTDLVTGETSTILPISVFTVEE